MSGRLRILRDGSGAGDWNMERDTALLHAHQPGDDPILRIYQWNPPCLTLGYNQREEAFAAADVTAAGYDLVRRPTGGRAILHAHELTYAVIGTSPGPLFGSSLHDAYMTINRALLRFLSGLGIDADVSSGESREAARSPVCFRSAGRHEIRVRGRNLVGSAQRRLRGVFLQHGSILAGPEHRRLVDYLDLDPTARAQQGEELQAGTTDLQEQLGRTLEPADLERLGDELAQAFAAALDLEPTSETI